MGARDLAERDETPRAAKPTINDVARLAGVSKKTVSRVINRSPLLNDDTRQRVEKVIRRARLHAQPAGARAGAAAATS